MGYQSDYTVQIVGAPERAQELAGVLNDVVGYGFYVIATSGAGEVFVGGVKWYEHSDDLRRVSLQFPGCSIEMQRVGEDHPDTWRQRFKDGREGEAVKAEIAFPGLRDPA